MTAKEKAIEAAKALYSAGTLSREEFDTLLAGLMSESRAVTPLGTLVVKEATDPEHPGFYIDLRKPGCDSEPEGMPDAPLAMVEFCQDEGDSPDGEPTLLLAFGALHRKKIRGTWNTRTASSIRGCPSISRAKTVKAVGFYLLCCEPVGFFIAKN